MTDTLAVGSITQLTETGTLTRFAPLERDEVDCAQFAKPDPRDERIKTLEAALAGAIAAGKGLGEVCEAWEKRDEVARERITELEAALSSIRTMLLDDQEENPTYAGAMAMAVVDIVLMPSPERDMNITQEAMDA